MRYRLRTLLIVVLVVAAYFGGRASMQPQMKSLENRTKAQELRIEKLKSDVDWFHERLAAGTQSRQQKRCEVSDLN